VVPVSARPEVGSAAETAVGLQFSRLVGVGVVGRSLDDGAGDPVEDRFDRTASVANRRRPPAARVLYGVATIGAI
jgi:hypothetical protein